MTSISYYKDHDDNDNDGRCPVQGCKYVETLERRIDTLVWNTVTKWTAIALIGILAGILGYGSHEISKHNDRVYELKEQVAKNTAFLIKGSSCYCGSSGESKKTDGGKSK